REHVRGVVPLGVQTYIWSACYASDAQARQAMLACKSPLDEAAAAAIVDAIRSNATLMAELRYWMSTMHVASLIGRDRIESATLLRRAVDSELGAGPPESTP
ncbi:MAG: hypothetical protein WD076_03800, partial [Parvularculaceae bacterium]